jgi:uncharacterized membrane protein
MPDIGGERSLAFLICTAWLVACGGRSAGPDDPPSVGSGDAAGAAGSGGAGTGGAGGTLGASPEPDPSPGGTCADGILDADEADIDCGGSRCGVCPTGATCHIDTDCEGRCLDGLCQQPTCEDGVHNGGELGPDCGGPCGRCPVILERCDCPSNDRLQPLACGGVDLWAAFSSADGATLVYSQNGETYRWDAATGGPLLLHPEASIAALSADGQAMLLRLEPSGTYELWRPGEMARVLPGPSARGMSDDARSVLFYDEDGRAATLWTDGLSLGVGVRVSPSSFDFPRALSADGRAVVGTRYVSDDSGGYERPFRWTPAGVEVLEPLPAGAVHGTAVATSGDGSVLAGWVSPSRDSATASIFRWSADRGFLEIAMSPLVPAFPPPLLSADGSVLVGTLGAEPDPSFERAFRWSEADGLLVLGGDTQSRASFMSADGRVIVGFRLPDDGTTRLFVWSSTLGLRDLATAVADAGTDVSGWTFESVAALSADGRVLYGMGQCGGQRAAYRAVLD